MKLTLLRLCVAAALLALYLPLEQYLGSLERRFNEPSLFRLRLPLPEGSTGQPVPALDPETLEVFLSGRFSNWEERSPSFRMERTASNEWSLALSLAGGSHPYKFVIHPGKAQGGAPLWIEDPFSSDYEDDSFGGRNSIHVVRSIKNTRLVLRFIFHALAIGILVFTVLDVLLTRLMRRRMSLRVKLLVIFISFLSVTNMFFIVFASFQRIEFAQRIQIDKIGMVQTMLASGGVDFAELGAPAMRQRLTRLLEAFLSRSELRQDYHGFSSSRHQITAVTVLDGDGHPLGGGLQPSYRRFLESRFTEPSHLEKFRSGFFKKALAGYRESGGYNKGLLSFVSFELFDAAERETWGDVNIVRNRTAARHFPDDCFIYPVFHEHRVRGYYLVEANGESYSDVFGEMLSLNLVLLGSILLLYYLLIRHVGGILLDPLNRLLEGIRHVHSEDYDYEIHIGTRDEIERLGEAYNYLRGRLAETREQMARYTSQLEGVAEEREKELNQAYRLIKEDLYLAKRIQQNILSGAADAVRGVGCAVSYQPLSEVGGDFYSIDAIDRHRLRVFLADATGHGVQAALVTMLIKSEYEKVKLLDDQAAVLAHLNSAFLTSYRQLTVFFTGVLVDIDTKRHRLHYVSAGHPVQYLLRGRELLELAEHGRMLGVVPETGCRVVTLEYRNEDRLLLFTDGLLEQFNPAGDELGENRLREMLHAGLADGLAGRTPQEIIDAVLRRSGEFRAGEERRDDLTLLCLDLHRSLAGRLKLG